MRHPAWLERWRWSARDLLRAKEYNLKLNRNQNEKRFSASQGLNPQTGLNAWLKRLWDADSEEIAGRKMFLLDWLRELRPAAAHVCRKCSWDYRCCADGCKHSGRWWATEASQAKGVQYRGKSWLPLATLSSFVVYSLHYRAQTHPRVKLLSKSPSFLFSLFLCLLFTFLLHLQL